MNYNLLEELTLSCNALKALLKAEILHGIAKQNDRGEPYIVNGDVILIKQKDGEYRVESQGPKGNTSR